MAKKITLKYFDSALDIVVTLGFIFMLLCAIFQVIFRYVLRISVPWTEEAARFALIFVTFWGGAIALREKEHIVIGAIFERLPQKFQAVLQLIFIAAMAWFLVNVFLGSIPMIKLTWNTPVGSIGWLKTGHVYLFLPTGIGFMLLYLALWAVETILDFTGSGNHTLQTTTEGGNNS
ncbi:putative permease protein [Candidatus Vecturithrix granuli]|uniref:Putative permease protein n=1 Tax=Vecturithrix granuli TaxID=1499967 RepID=A0A0S6W9K9_VECG1|nr:putative permease protein [Candidatus Vecturithrix granuli]